jgi:ArsR family transcriptional regulator
LRYIDLVVQLLAIARALGDPTRVRIIAALRNGELCVCELVDALDISQSSLSSHLQICRQAGAVTTRKESRWIYYSLSTRYGLLIERIFSELLIVGSDRQLRRDARRLKKRLQMREGGRCVVGFGRLKPERELADVVD